MPYVYGKEVLFMDPETIMYYRGLEDGLNKAKELFVLRGKDSLVLMDLLVQELRKKRTENVWWDLWENIGINPDNIELVGVEQ